MINVKKNKNLTKRLKTFFSRQLKIFRLSISQTSFLNLLSILCDAAVLFSYSLATAFFSYLFRSFFSDIDVLASSFLGRSDVLLQASVFVLGMGFILLSYAATILVYSLLQGFIFTKYLKKEYNLNIVFSFMKKNIAYAFLTLIIIYLFRFLLVEPFWQFANFMVIVFFVWSLPVAHVRAIMNPSEKTFKNVFASIKLFFSHLKKLLFPALVVVIIMTILLAFTLVFGLVSYDLEMFMTFLIGLAVLSWAKRYMIIVVRLLEK